jgi:hypothetical protein
VAIRAVKTIEIPPLVVTQGSVQEFPFEFEVDARRSTTSLSQVDQTQVAVFVTQVGPKVRLAIRSLATAPIFPAPPFTVTLAGKLAIVAATGMLLVRVLRVEAGKLTLDTEAGTRFERPLVFGIASAVVSSHPSWLSIGRVAFNAAWTTPLFRVEMEAVTVESGPFELESEREVPRVPVQVVVRKAAAFELGRS